MRFRRSFGPSMILEYVSEAADQAVMAVFGGSPIGRDRICANTQIAFGNFRAAEQFAPASLQRDASRLHNVGPIGNGKRHLRILFRQQNRNSVRAQAVDEAKDFSH